MQILGPTPDLLGRFWGQKPGTCVLTRPPGNSDACFSLRTSDLERSKVNNRIWRKQFGKKKTRKNIILISNLYVPMLLQSSSSNQIPQTSCTDLEGLMHGTPHPFGEWDLARMELTVKTGNHWLVSQPWLWVASFHNSVIPWLSKCYYFNISVFIFQIYSIIVHAFSSQIIPHQIHIQN